MYKMPFESGGVSDSGCKPLYMTGSNICSARWLVAGQMCASRGGNWQKLQVCHFLFGALIRMRWRCVTICHTCLANSCNFPAEGFVYCVPKICQSKYDSNLSN